MRIAFLQAKINSIVGGCVVLLCVSDEIVCTVCGSATITCASALAADRSGEPGGLIRHFTEGIFVVFPRLQVHQQSCLLAICGCLACIDAIVDGVDALLNAGYLRQRLGIVRRQLGLGGQELDSLDSYVLH